MILVLPTWVWAVSELEGMGELRNRNKQLISGFQSSCNPTIKLLFPKQSSSSLLSLAEEERIYEIRAIELESAAWLELNEKWYLALRHFVLNLYTCTEDEIIMMCSLFQIPKWISWTKWILRTWIELSHFKDWVTGCDV